MLINKVMSSPVISVIVPVYKTEEYLSKCIESILSQSFTDFELLLIDDGSPDRCGEICEEYARKDSRIRVFHQENRGNSAACNLGLDNSCGKYIVFVDSDDWVLPDYLQALYADVCVYPGIGLIIHGMKRVTTRKEPLSDLVAPEVYLPQAQIGKAFTDYNIAEMGYIVSKIYDKSVLDAHHIRLDESIHFREDLLLMYQYLFYCDYIYTRPVTNYVYLIRPFSMSTGHLNVFETEHKGVISFLKMLRRMKEKWNVNKELYIKFLLIFPFQRALKTDYQPYHCVDRKTRMEHLKELVDSVGEYLPICTRTGYKIDWFGGMLLKYRLFSCYDWFISLMFRFPVRRFSYDSVRASSKEVLGGL